MRAFCFDDLLLSLSLSHSLSSFRIMIQDDCVETRGRFGLRPMTIMIVRFLTVTVMFSPSSVFASLLSRI